MTPELINWIVLGLFAAEIAAIVLWRRGKYPGMLFNEWALFVYSLLVPATLLIGALLSYLFVPEQETAQRHANTLIGFALLGGIASGILLALSAFFHWIVRTDLSRPPE